MVERFNEVDTDVNKPVVSLPFITISREYGCPAKDIATLLVRKLNSKPDRKLENNWRMISKEIFEDTSKELKVDPKRIQKIFNIENRGTINEILNSLSVKYYHSDIKVRKTLSVIIADFAKKGNVVIVGRGGVCVTNHLKNGIHIKLTAPFEWRTERIQEIKKCASKEAAKKLAIEVDAKRAELLKIMSNNTFDSSIFDVTYNCKSFNKEEIADSIIYHLGLKGSI